MDLCVVYICDVLLFSLGGWSLVIMYRDFWVVKDVIFEVFYWKDGDVFGKDNFFFLGIVLYYVNKLVSGLVLIVV